MKLKGCQGELFSWLLLQAGACGSPTCHRVAVGAGRLGAEAVDEGGGNPPPVGRCLCGTSVCRHRANERALVLKKSVCEPADAVHRIFRSRLARRKLIRYC